VSMREDKIFGILKMEIHIDKTVDMSSPRSGI